MLAKHIVHPMLEDKEYFFVGFRDQKDIDDFCKKCPWFDKEGAEIGNKFVIEYHKDPEWYEILPWVYFGNYLNNMMNVYNSINTQYAMF